MVRVALFAGEFGFIDIKFKKFNAKARRRKDAKLNQKNPLRLCIFAPLALK